MSFERSFSSPAAWTAGKIVLVGLILLHSVWIIIHLNLVSQGRISPWKLGGYGMYTIPNPRPKLFVYDMNFSPYRVSPKELKLREFVMKSRAMVFRCQPYPEPALIALFQENPDLVNRKLRLVTVERKFLHNPIRSETLPHAVMDIKWPEPGFFKYAGTFCDKSYRGKVQLKR